MTDVSVAGQQFPGGGILVFCLCMLTQYSGFRDLDSSLFSLVLRNLNILARVLIRNPGNKGWKGLILEKLSTMCIQSVTTNMKIAYIMTINMLNQM